MEKIHIGTLLTTLIVGIALVALAAAPLESDLKIPSSGQVETRVTAQSGSVKDIQVAVNLAISTRATDVYIPEGNWTFAADGYPSSPWPPFPTTGTNFVGINVPSQGLNIFGAGINKTILDLPDNVTTANTVMFIICGGYEDANNIWHSGGKFRISGITFVGRNAPNSITGDVAVNIVSCKDFRVDHCSFYYMGDTCIPVDDQPTQYGIYGGDPARISQGVVDHCSFYHIFKEACFEAGNGYGYGVQVVRAEAYEWICWDTNIWDYMGKYNGNVYIENDYFIGMRHCVASIGGGEYVFRYNTVVDADMEEMSLTGHPVRQDILGCRGYECYNNTFTYDGKSGVNFFGPGWKAGGGLVYNNTMTNLTYGFVLGDCEYNDSFYPEGNVEDLYIWSNKMISCTQNLYQEPAYQYGGWTGPVAVEGTDYFSDLNGKYTTAQVQAMVNSHNYTPYPYPHPLTSG
jgi:hypothetical protein